MRDSKTTKFKKGVRITEENYYWIIREKGKKSIAGKLKEIIEFYKKNGLI